MLKCKYCGGDVVASGSGFKCVFCSNYFDSEDELKPRKKAKPAVSPSAPPEQKSSVAPQKKSNNGVDVFNTNINSVLEITWADEKFTHSGSGFIINKDGYAITNTHVVTEDSGAPCNNIKVRVAGVETAAEIIKLGDDHHGEGNGVDLALIKLAAVPANATVITFEDFNNVRNGESLFVIGNSLGYGTCITSGIVSDRLRSVNGKMLLMTDCAINGGNSGGPVFNEKGLVIGAVVSGIPSAEGMNFVIPCDTIIDFINAPAQNVSKDAEADAEMHIDSIEELLGILQAEDISNLNDEQLYRFGEIMQYISEDLLYEVLAESKQIAELVLDTMIEGLNEARAAGDEALAAELEESLMILELIVALVHGGDSSEEEVMDTVEKIKAVSKKYAPAIDNSISSAKAKKCGAKFTPLDIIAAIIVPIAVPVLVDLGRWLMSRKK